MHNYMVSYMTRIVQSELDEEEFQQFEKLCREKNLSKKEAIQLAIKNWIQTHQPLPKEDPLFTFNAKEAETKTSARDIDKVVYSTKEPKK